MSGLLSHSSWLCRIAFGVLGFPIAASPVAHATDSVFILAQADKSEEPKKATSAVYVVKPVAEKKVKHLPEGPLYWRVVSFPYPCTGTGRHWTGSLESEYGKL